MKKKVAVLGAGLVGKAIAIDLSKDFEVTSLDVNAIALKALEVRGVNTHAMDVTNRGRLQTFLQPFDLVIGAVPGFLGFETCRSVIEAGKNMVDISFFAEDPFGLDDLARDTDVIAVTDCGVAPGMGNIILGYHNGRMKVESYECLVGGLPVIREWPFEYKAVFSPIDVIEEYTRPARYVQNGALVVKEALSDPELIHFPKVGTLESWNSDGLRSLIKTMHGIPNMIEKTLRYPGTIEYLRVLRAAGFFSNEEVEVKGTRVKPIDVTAQLLFPKWMLQPDEQEFTIMRIRIDGEEQGKHKRYEYNVLDYTDKETGTWSMARTTGYTCAAVAHLILDGRYSRKGISPPEYVGEDEKNFRYVLDYLKARGVNYSKSEYRD